MNTILARIGIAAIVFMFGLGAGLRLQAWRIDSAGRKQLARQLDDERVEVSRLNKLAFDVGQALGAEARARSADGVKAAAAIDQWKRKGVLYVQCPTAAAPQAVAGDAVRFDAGYVGAWNGGLCLALSAAARGDCLAAGGAVVGSAGSTHPAVR